MLAFSLPSSTLLCFGYRNPWKVRNLSVFVYKYIQDILQVCKSAQLCSQAREMSTAAPHSHGASFQMWCFSVCVCLCVSAVCNLLFEGHHLQSVCGWRFLKWVIGAPGSEEMSHRSLYGASCMCMRFCVVLCNLCVCVCVYVTVILMDVHAFVCMHVYSRKQLPQFLNKTAGRCSLLLRK